MKDDMLHYGGIYYDPEHRDEFAWAGEAIPTVRCGLPRAEVEWLGSFVSWANAHVQERPCCPECTRIVAVETGAVAGSA